MTAEYISRGVSPTKDDVHNAIKNQEKGVFPGAFCKVTDDFLGDPKYCSIMHADGAGTKAIVAYMSYKETGSPKVFCGIAQDSTVMNIDDMACVGAVDKFLLSNTIGRNAHRIDGSVLSNIIEGYSNFAQKLSQYGIDILLTGGETADVGDMVSTLIADSTAFARLERDRVVNCQNISQGDVIVGLSSTGKAVYEEAHNSGMGSNGLTAARHLLLSHYYAEKYPETFSNTIPKEKVYCGKHRLEDKIPESGQTVGEALLSPTRTYLPIVKEVLEKHFHSVSGIIHCTGGGQTKCGFFGEGLHYVKDNLFATPALFKLIQSESKMQINEMYQVFNMGHRLEVYCKKEAANAIIGIAQSFGIDAKIVGEVFKNHDRKNKTTIVHDKKELHY